MKPSFTLFIDETIFYSPQTQYIIYFLIRVKLYYKRYLECYINV